MSTGCRISLEEFDRRDKDKNGELHAKEVTPAPRSARTPSTSSSPFGFGAMGLPDVLARAAVKKKIARRRMRNERRV